MPEWIYFIHPPRDNFAATMTDAEKAVWAEHFERLQRMLADGQLIMAGPTLGRANTGLAVFEAPDADAAQQIMAADPAISSGYARESCARSGCRCSADATNPGGRLACPPWRHWQSSARRWWTSRSRSSRSRWSRPRAAAERSVAESGFLLLGEVHGVRENPLIIAALLREFGLAGLALEWLGGLDPVVSAFLAGEGLADHPLLWADDGRSTAGTGWPSCASWRPRARWS